MTSGTGSPCGACKFLRRKCAADCIFAPYFSSEQGPVRFAAIHKVFGASNVSKLLLHVPVPDRCEAVVTIAYEAQARIRDPVYGCVSHIFALQQQVAYLQAQLMQVKSQLTQKLIIDQSSRNADQNQWPSAAAAAAAAAAVGSIAPGFMGSSSPIYPFSNYMNQCSNISPQSSLDSINDHPINGIQEIHSRDVDQLANYQNYSSKKRPSQTDLSELQALALRMMKNDN